MTERTGNGWQTPDWFLDLVIDAFEGPIDWDPCTWPDNPTGARIFYTERMNGLGVSWGRNAFVNPPYGRGHMEPWAEKIVAEARRGVEIIALTRGDTSTKWARLLLGTCQAVCFPPRIKFKGAKGSPNFANLVFYFGDNRRRFERVFSDLGPVL